MRLATRVAGTLGAAMALAVSGWSATAASAAPSATANVSHSCGRVTTPGLKSCFALRRTDVASVFSMAPAATPGGYGPTDLRSAYKVPATTAAPTVAIVDAYNDPNAESDLATYRSQYGLPACTTANGCFTKVNQTGAASPLPGNDSGWAGEISLDLDMVSAICPTCKILLVEANSAYGSDLYTAVDYAAAHARYVSNSWGGSEYSGQTTDDAHFNHPGVAITVSTGDSGYGAQYPATSRYVTAVGGTSLNRSGNTRGWSETTWNGAGSGCSAYDAKPSWQTVTTGCSRRGEADVSAVADPNTGVAVYQTYGASGWSVYGGTSAAAPIVAAVYAVAGTPGSTDYPASYPYAHAGSLFDVTSGSNGSCGAPMCTAGTGWDGPTGLGTPNGTAAFTPPGGGSTPAVSVTDPGGRTATVGTATSLTLTASGGTGSYTWSATGLPAGLSLTASTGVISGTPTTAGTSTVTATATSGTLSGSATFTWTVSSTSTCTAAQLLGNTGLESGAAPWSATAGVVSSTTDGETPHSGTRYAWLDGYGVSHTDTLSQRVTIPSACGSALLSYWLKIDTRESAGTANDRLKVTVGSTTVASYTNLNAGPYAWHSVDLSAYKGQTVTVTFTGTENASLATSFVLDDLFLRVQ